MSPEEVEDQEVEAVYEFYLKKWKEEVEDVCECHLKKWRISKLRCLNDT